MEEFGKALIRDLKDFFKFEQVCGGEEGLDRWVIIPDINRPGLELCGYFVGSEPRRIIIMGNKESSYMKTLEQDVLKERLEKLSDEYTPCMIFSKDVEIPDVLIELGNYKAFPVFRSSMPTYQLMVDVISFLSEKLAPNTNVHGVLISMFGKGVMITGESGMGKSETALELIKKGHILVADDRVDVFKYHNSIFGTSTELLEGMLEIRGIGIIDVNKMFGASATLSKSDIDFVISLEKWNEDKQYTRVGIEEEDQYYEVLGVKIPMQTIPVKEGRNIAVLVESAVTNFNLKEKGINSSKEFEQRVYDYIKSQNKENQ
ncbi:MAG: HPr(Ser) kinase/phosphatase [Erysipelotrichaceae bacterium]|nr:HPr(Ser) kinase/phosphatase [Erysipelotrichaceae bacterium]